MDFFPEFVDARFLIVQGLGLVGFIIYIASFQILSPRKTILVQAVSQPFHMAHFIGLGAWFLAVLGLMAALRDLVSALVDDKRLHRLCMLLYFVAIYGAGYFMVQATGDYMGLVGSTSSTISQFFRERFYAYRGLMLLHNIMWLGAYVYAGSIPGAVVMLGITASNVFGIIRFMRADRGGSSAVE